MLHNKTSNKRFIIQHAKFVRANFTNIYLQRKGDRYVRSGTELAREIQLTILIQRQETCLTDPLEYKYRVIFVLVLSVICTLQSAIG